MRATPVSELLSALAFAGLLGAGPPPSPEPDLRPGLNFGIDGVVGTDETVTAMDTADRFHALRDDFFAVTYWYDPYLGNDNNPCSQVHPCQTFSKLKSNLGPYTRSEVVGGRWFASMTLLLRESTFAVGENPYVSGEDLTWTGGTGTVLDFFVSGTTLVMPIRVLSGSAPTTATTDIKGNTSGTVTAVAAVWDSMGAHGSSLTVTSGSGGAGTGTFTLSAGNWIDKGAIIGSSYTFSGFATCTACNATWRVTHLAASVVTVADPGDVITAEAGTGNEAFVGNNTNLITWRGSSADSDQVIALVESASYAKRFHIDCNGTHPDGGTSGGLFSPAHTARLGWIGVARADIQWCDVDGFSPTNFGDIVTVGTSVSHARNVVNGNHQGYTGHEDSHSIHLNFRSESDVTTVNGAPIAFNDMNTTSAMIGGEAYVDVTSSANSAAGYSGGQNLLMDVFLGIIGTANQGYGIQADTTPGGGSRNGDIVLQLSRVTIVNNGIGNAGCIYLDTDATFTLRLTGRQVTCTGKRGMFLDALATPGTLTVDMRGWLSDGLTSYHFLQPTGSASDYDVTMRGTIDTGEANPEIMIAGSNYHTIGAAAAAAAGAGWEFFTVGSHEVTTQDARARWGVYTDPYTITLPTCVPAAVFGAPVCSVRRNEAGGNAGAR